MAKATHGEINNTFLFSVAKDVAKKFEGDYSLCNIIFTNQRAKTFFNQAIYSVEQKPFFAPSFYTIDDFVKTKTLLVLADEVVLVYWLYEVYCKVYYTYNADINLEDRETFEHFFFWGKMLLADFDDIDKNCGKAQDIFTIIKDYKEIESRWDFLDSEQKKILQQFFGDKFKGNFSALQKNFVCVWNCLGEIYSQYNDLLRQKGIAYSGMLYKDALNNMQQEQENDSEYCVVGFNVLNKVEKSILLWLKEHSKTRFYWDLDSYYVDDKRQEAGLFMRENIASFPSPESFMPQTDMILNNQCKINIVSAISETQQVGYISHWLNSLPEGVEQKDVAIILCNESLLPSVISALPQQFEGQDMRVNITMGYDFSTTPLYALIDEYLSYQYSVSNSQSVMVQALKPFTNNNYVKKAFSEVNDLIDKKKYLLLSPERNEITNPILLSILQKKTGFEELFSAIESIVTLVEENNTTVMPEVIYRLRCAIESLRTLFNQNPQIKNITSNLLYITIRRVLSSIRIPFLSDQINGVQIMGLLESRSLDFKHILFLSANDDLLPNVSSQSSFIPYSIRKSYDLTTMERKIAVFAYYFYRLLQRSQSIEYLYNATSTDTKPKEMSRFLKQIVIESGKQINTLSLPAHIELQEKTLIEIEKTNEHKDKILQKATNKYLSPSYLNNYFNCEYKFYLHDVMGVTPLQKETDDIDPIQFGVIFHSSMYKFYTLLYGQTLPYSVNRKDIEDNISKVEEIVRQQFNIVLFASDDTKVETNYTQMHKIHLHELTYYVRKMLQIDCCYAPFTIVAQEKKITKQMTLLSQQINIGGVIDRIDYKDGVLRVIDYKTGGSEKKPCEQEDLFWVDYANKQQVVVRNDYFAQILIYCWLLTDNSEAQKEFESVDLSSCLIRPTLLYIKKTLEKTSDIGLIKFLSSQEPLERYTREINALVQAELEQGVSRLISDNGGKCLRHRDDNKCKYCDYNRLC